MKFHFGSKTKEADEVLLKVVADPNVDETKWLPAMEVLGSKELVPPQAVVDPLNKPHPVQQGLISFLGSSITATILVVGQIFMVAAGAVASGELASSVFSLSFYRIMYLCGPQDSFMGVFVIAAVPIFWCAWYLRNRRILKYSALCTIGLLVTYLLGVELGSINGIVQVALSALVLALFAAFHLAGSFFSSFRAYWPRSFSVSRCLLVCYVPAILVLVFEFFILDPSQTIERVNAESLWMSIGSIAFFSLLPAFMTGLNAKTRRFGSTLGLAAIGQFPVLACMLLYCVANLIMLSCVHIFGASAVAELFEKLAGGMFPPDFDLTSSNYAELISKVISSVLVLASLLLSVCGGSYLAVLWNRFMHKRHEKKQLEKEALKLSP